MGILCKIITKQKTYIKNNKKKKVDENDEYGGGYISDDYDQDDSSWRVRKTAISLIETLIRSRGDLMK